MKPQHSLSRPLRKRSPDLQALIRAGYRLTFHEAPSWLTRVMHWLKPAINPMYWHEPSEWITVQGIPYVRPAFHGSALMVARGDLAVPLWIKGNATVQPKEHWAVWHGDIPCFSTGEPRSNILAPNLEAFNGVIVLSQQPPAGLYLDHYDKIETYVSFIEPQARRLNSRVSARCQRS